MGKVVTGDALVARLRAIRQAQRKSAQDLADTIGVLSRASIANIESGHRRPYTYDEARLIAEALEVDLRDVIGPEPLTITIRPAEQVIV